MTEEIYISRCRVPLYRHQAEAIKTLSNGQVLVGGVGSGKSRTSLAFYIYHELELGEFKVVSNDRDVLVNFEYDLSDYQGEKKKLVIITTATKRDKLEWEEEALPFGLTYNDASPVDIVVDSWNNIGKYANEEGSFFIFDEQRLVTTGTWSKFFLTIVKSNSWILLSATPGDSYSDYLTLFLAHGFYKNKTEFNREHCVFSRFSKFPKIERYVGVAKLEKYRRSLLVMMPDQRTTEQIHKNIQCDYDKEAYSVIFKDRWDPYDQVPIEDAGKMCLLLRRLVNTNDSRFEALWQIFCLKKKIIVFYNFNVELEMLRDLFNSKGIPFSEWNGHRHESIPDSDEWVYLVQYTAGCEGWNCTLTDTIVFFSQNYSYKVMVQAAGRIDRINTPFTELYYYHLISSSNIDKAIMLALKKKKNFNERSFVKF